MIGYMLIPCNLIYSLVLFYVQASKARFGLETNFVQRYVFQTVLTYLTCATFIQCSTCSNTSPLIANGKGKGISISNM